MPGKILFFEDDINNMGNPILAALTGAGCISEEEYNSYNDKLKDCESFNKILNYKGVELVGSSFDSAIGKIHNIGDGHEYNLIFIDRNLEKYADLPKGSESGGKTNAKVPLNIFHYGGEEFSSDFFNFFYNFLGDYIYFRLVQNKVPAEKIFFLTGNPIDPKDDNNNGNNDFKAAPFIKIDKSKMIAKDKRISESSNSERVSGLVPADAETEQVEETESILTKILKNEGKDAITRNKYSDIFNSDEIKNLFDGTRYLDDFLTLLTQMRLDEKIVPSAGATLRLMIEQIVDKLKPSWSVRNFLNSSGYMEKFKPADKKKMEKYAKFLNSGEQGFEREEIEEFSKISHQILFDCYTVVYSTPTHDNQPFPKYIYSFIDNIYTTTSECSMHGGGDDSRQLSQEGWHALLNGMCQILRWYQNSSGHSKRRSGTIKWLDKSKGRGFLCDNMFFHMNDLDGVCFKDLHVGETLEYEIGENYIGPCAVKIRRPVKK